MTLEPFTLVIMLIVFVTTLSQSTFGFGNALLSMPLLTLFLDVTTATPLVALLAVTVSVSILVADRRHLRLEGSWYLIGSSLLGVPVGVLWLKYAPEAMVKSVLGVVVVGFALFGLLTPRRQHLADERWAGGFGFIAGILGGAYNTHGPPLVIYGTLRDWSQEHFRATLQGCFLPITCLALVLHGHNGWLTVPVLELYALCFPSALGGIVLGRLVNSRFPRDQFVRYVYVLLLLLGAALVVQFGPRACS